MVIVEAVMVLIALLAEGIERATTPDKAPAEPEQIISLLQMLT